jgi:phosphatidylglycerol:prolipoprotein diacylglycerol transferase
MLQTLFYVSNGPFFGLPVFGLGWALIIWAVVAAVILLVVVRRHGWSGDTWSYILLLGAFGGAIYFVVPNLLDASGQGLPIRGFGVMLLLAVVSGVGLCLYRARQMGVDPEVIFSLSFWMFLLGILGARLFFVIEYLPQFIRDKETWLEVGQSIVNVPQGGIVLYGAFFGGITAALLFFHRRKLPALALADIIVPGMVVGAALGRVGCFLNGCCFGGLCEANLPQVEFPAMSPPYQHQLAHGWLHGLRLTEDHGRVVISEVLPDSPAKAAGLKAGDEIAAINNEPVATVDATEERLLPVPGIVRVKLADRTEHLLKFSLPPRSLPVHPAQLYDAINLGLMALVLWLYYPLRRHEGELLAVGMMFYAITRFVIEIIRVDEPSQLGTGFSISQLISFGVFLAGVLLLTYVELRNRPFVLPWHGKAATAS